jgi:hypothetical protein
MLGDLTECISVFKVIAAHQIIVDWVDSDFRSWFEKCVDDMAEMES